MATTLGYIDDGIVERAYLNESPALYPRVEFAFRPMTIEERVGYYKAAERLQGMALRELVAGLLAAKLVSWDLADSKGTIVPIEVSRVLRLKERLFTRLFAVISTEEAPDGCLDRDDAEARAATLDLLEAAKTGRSVADVREERRRKNSPPASGS